MKPEKIKIWHFVLAIWLVILLFRFTLLINIAELIWYSILVLFNDYNFLLSHLNFQLIDAYLSLIIMLLIPILALVKGIRKRILDFNINFSRIFVVLLMFSFLIPSLITREHPELQKNISEIKLIPPFSIIYEMELKSYKYLSDESIKERFLNSKDKVLLKEFFPEKIFVREYSIDKHNYILNLNNKFLSIPADSIISAKSDIVLLGTDEFGRDIFSRLIYGARISIFVGSTAVIISLMLGLILGYIASSGKTVLSVILNRLNDLFLSFPAIFFVILVLALFGNNLLSVVVVLGFSGWMSLFKIVSSEVAALKQKDFFITASRLGLNNSELLFKEILPVIIIPVAVNIVFQFSNVVLAESALSFLGLGIGSQYPSWGSMIEKGQQYIFDAWWMLFIPGIVLVLTLLSFHNIAKEVNKYFNPKIS